MRVAIFTETYFPFISGVVTHIETLKKGLEAQGHKVMIVTLDPKTKEHYLKDGILYCPSMPLKKIYGYGVANPLNLRRLAYIKAFNPDIIHVQTEFTMGLFGLFCAKRLKKPVVYTLHTMYDDYLFYVAPGKRMQKLVKPGAHWYFRRIAKRATEIIGPSTKVVEFLRRCGVERHVNIIPNTVDLSDFMVENVDPKEIEKTKEKLGIQPGDVCLFFVGRLGKEKSLDVLIDLFSENFAGESRFKLLIAGGGPEAAALRELVAEKKMQSQSQLLGRIDHNLLPPYFQACNLFATASLSEINSISMLEAMASGLYIAQRLDPYNRAQINEGVNGDIFTDSEGFAKIIRDWDAKSVEEKAALRKTVSDTTRRYGEEEFTRAVLDVYHRAILGYRG